MTIEKLIKELQQYPKTYEVLLSNDEELNTLYGEAMVSELSDRKKTVVLWGTTRSIIGL